MSTQEAPERKGVLSEVSISTVIATSLAAVTSFVLSSKIGLAGSLIGTGLAAAASSIATQVYKGMLQRSADRLRDLAPVMGAQDEEAAAAARRNHGAVGRETLSDKTSPRLMVAETGTPVAPERMRVAVAEREARELRRRVTIVASAVAVLVALATAGVIALATNGLGLWNEPAEPAEEWYEEEYVEEEVVAEPVEQSVTESTTTEQVTSPEQTTDTTAADTAGTTTGGTATSGEAAAADGSTAQAQTQPQTQPQGQSQAQAQGQADTPTTQGDVAAQTTGNASAAQSATSMATTTSTSAA